MPVHPPQRAPTIPFVQASSSSAAYIARHAWIHVLPPNFGWPPPLLPSNLYALPLTDHSYHTDVKNPQIHSTFEVGESSANSNPNMQASSPLQE